MLQGWFIVVVALAYIGFLFLVASYGDRSRKRVRGSSARLLIYPLSLAIYCTSWTFFGSVGVAARTGFDFLTIYIGPVLMVGLAYPLIIRIVRLAKGQNITSIADFIAARYGKSQAVAATVALIAIVGMIPYIALQLKAVSSSVSTILAEAAPGGMAPPFGDLALFVALAMATFAVLFGTRHIDATEHQDGLMLAIATESVVKLIAFLAVGIFVTFVMFGGPSALLAQALDRPNTAAVLTRAPQTASFGAMTLLSLFAIVLLPRQFHVAVVENHSESEIRRAAWLFPLYLVLINIFVLPIAMAGLLTFAAGRVDSDMFVVALPLAAQSQLITLVAFIGGLSAATAMVIVETVALGIMVSNDIVMPLTLKRRAIAGEPIDAGAQLLTTRRIAIFAILFLAYAYYRSAGDAQLAAIGLLSFAAVAQLAPAFFGGLIWRRSTSLGAIAGMSAGILVWAYTLLLPSISDAGIVSARILADGPWGVASLRPEALFGLDLPPLVHGVLLSLAANIACYIGFSLARSPTAIERVQGDLFAPPTLAPMLGPMAPGFRLRRASVSVEDLIATVARYLGDERTRRSFASFAAARRMSLDGAAEADFQLLQYAEYLLASAIGAASSRLVLSLLLRKRTVSTKAALKLLDDASAAIHYNREILQTALDHVRQGIAVFDKELALVCWNRQFGEILDLPHELTRVGIPLHDILRHIARHEDANPKSDTFIAERVANYTNSVEPFLERIAEQALVIEVRANHMPGGGLVTTFTDITPSVKAAEALERANATLERRVRERTGELTRLNAALERAKAEADEANVSKTRFVAAASHDILQPLNAARLYVTSLIERHGSGEDTALIENIDASLEAVEEIFSALLDISRLDTGAMKPELADFRIDELLHRLEVEFTPLAREKGLDFLVMPCSLSVRSDRRLLRRLLQNLISNAIKYTPTGRVLVGCRRCGERLRIAVHDTGIGIPRAKHRAVFKEFHRLDQGARVARGVGLGLSIVERIARVLDCEVTLKSNSGQGSDQGGVQDSSHGSCFAVEVPRAAGITPVFAPSTARRLEPGRLDGMVVLCIDNERAIIDGMATLLGRWGCRVLKGADLAEAMTVLDASGLEPDGLLVDYHLDGGNGIATIRALRHRLGRSDGRDVPAIVITADRSIHVREEARAEGAHVLNKPIKPASLRALMMQWRVQRVAAE
jgi:Na+/proline symporter/signal transduction histidine kinase/ActR/RegA family two-component response regulator